MLQSDPGISQSMSLRGLRTPPTSKMSSVSEKELLEEFEEMFPKQGLAIASSRTSRSCSVLLPSQPEFAFTSSLSKVLPMMANDGDESCRADGLSLLTSS